MTKLQERLSAQWYHVLNLAIGLWLVASPWVLGYAAETAVAWNAYGVGAALVLLSALALYSHQKWEDWVTLAIALWLIVSPWVLGHSILQTVVWNSTVTGLIAGVLALWSAANEYGFGRLALRS